MEDQSPENGKEGKREEKYIAQERQGKTKRRRRKEEGEEGKQLCIRRSYSARQSAEKCMGFFKIILKR